MPASAVDLLQGTLDVTDGSLYVSLHRLEERGLVESEWASPTSESAPASIGSPPPAGSS